MRSRIGFGAWSLAGALVAVFAAVLWPASAGAKAPPRYLPGVVIVGYAHQGPRAAADVAGAAASTSVSGVAQTKVVHVRRGVSVASELRRLRHQPGVAYAVPDYEAHIAAAAAPPSWIPNDPGPANVPQGWTKLQWNFLPGAGVNAPEAWANLLAVHRAGARGVVIAVLDTGIAYRNWGKYRKSPDFRWTHFVAPHDFVAGNRFPLDREGHGTFVTGTIAESTNDGSALTGLAYNASIMPVRVLNQEGWGDAATIARGVRYAVAHGAQVINLSLEFDPSVTARDIPTLISAIQYAHRRGVVIVAASGNEGSPRRIAYPAAVPHVISVGATTSDRCLAYYSNGGRHLDLVAPGGGDDYDFANDPDCHPDRSLPDVFQMTFGNSFHPDRFGYPNGWYGTSMAAPHVSATAAMIIASGVIGRRPSPNQILARLEATAQGLGGSKPNANYGYGLLDAGAATAPKGTPTGTTGPTGPTGPS